MLTLSDQLSQIYWETVDKSADNKTNAIRRINDLQRVICARQDWWFLEDSYDITTIANQQSYDFAVNHRRVKTVQATIGGYTYPPLKEVKNDKKWDAMNSSSTYVTSSDIPTHYHIRFNRLYLFPTPSSAGGTITVFFTKRPTPLENQDYLSGSIAVTNGSTTVTGTSTTWTDLTFNGSNYIEIKGLWYKIASFTDNDTLVLSAKYQGTTASGIDYRIGDVSAIHPDFQSILWKQYAEEYWGRKKDADRAVYYRSLRQEVTALMEASASSETGDITWSLNEEHILPDPSINTLDLVGS